MPAGTRAFVLAQIERDTRNRPTELPIATITAIAPGGGTDAQTLVTVDYQEPARSSSPSALQPHMDLLHARRPRPASPSPKWAACGRSSAAPSATPPKRGPRPVLTEPLTGARYPDQNDAALGGTQIGWATQDLAGVTVPRFATGGARDTAYAAKVAAGYPMAAGMECYVGGRKMRHNGTAWDYVPTHRGNGATYPASPVEGDTYRHDTLRCTMRYRNAAWVQADLARVANDGDRVSYLAALGTAGVLMHGGFMVRQDDTDMLWWADTNTTLAPSGPTAGPGTRSPPPPATGTPSTPPSTAA
jgi:hypothetical protein